MKKVLLIFLGGASLGVLCTWLVLREGDLPPPRSPPKPLALAPAPARDGEAPAPEHPPEPAAAPPSRSARPTRAPAPPVSDNPATRDAAPVTIHGSPFPAAAPTPPPRPFPALPRAGSRENLDDPPQPDASATASPPAPLYRGTIRGHVRWVGPRPTLAPISVPRDSAAACGNEKTPARLLIDADGGVKNAVVSLLESGSRRHPVQRGGAVVLRIKNCELEPHLQVVRRGASITLSNADPIAHDLQVDFTKIPRRTDPLEPAWNRRLFDFQLESARSSKRWLPAKIGLVRVSSESHPWMSAYVFLASHRRHVITDASGGFRFEVPVGAYELSMWHESWSSEQRHAGTAARTRFFVTPGATVNVDFEIQGDAARAVRRIVRR